MFLVHCVSMVITMCHKFRVTRLKCIKVMRVLIRLLIVIGQHACGIVTVTGQRDLPLGQGIHEVPRKHIME